MTSFAVAEASEKKDTAQESQASVPADDSKTVIPVGSTSMAIPLPGLARGPTEPSGEVKLPSTTSKTEAKASSPTEEAQPKPGTITITHRGGKPSIQSLKPERWLADLQRAKSAAVIAHSDAALKVLERMAVTGCVYRDTAAVNAAVIEELKSTGVLLPPAPTEPTAVVKPARPKRAIESIATEVREALEHPDDDRVTTLTKDDLARLEGTNAFTRRLAQIASHTLKLLKPPKEKKEAAATQPKTDKKSAPEPEKTPALASVPMSSAPSVSVSPVEDKDPVVASSTTTKTKDAYVPPAITVKLLKTARANRDNDKDLDTSPASPAMTPEEREKASKDLRSKLPNMSKTDKVITALDKLFTEVVDTEWMDRLRTEMLSALGQLDPHWNDLKPKARQAFEGMFAKINEFGGMRGAVGEISAAAFALAQGRTEVSVSNEKLFLPDTFDTKTKKPKPGDDSQDVDVTSNKGGDRFYTEAKYDMQTFLKKAASLVKDTGALTSADLKTPEKSEDTKVEITPSTASTEAVDEVTPEVDEDNDDVLATAITGATEAKTTSSTAVPYRPEQLERYQRAAMRTKTKKPRKQQRQMNLEIFIGNRRGWPQLFMRDKLVTYMASNKWHLYVDGIDLMAGATPFTGRVLELRKAFADGRPAVASSVDEAKSSPTVEPKPSPTDEVKATGEAKPSTTTKAKRAKSPKAMELEAFKAWLDELSVKVGPRDFLALSVNELVKAHPVS